MSSTYKGRSLHQFIQPGTIEELRTQLFNDYIERMLNRTRNVHNYSQEKTKYWLIWLAQRMNKASQTTFFIDQLQSNWLTNKFGKAVYEIIICQFIGHIVSLIILLITKVEDKFVRERIFVIIINFSWKQLIIWLGGEFIVGLIMGLIIYIIWQYIAVSFKLDHIPITVKKINLSYKTSFIGIACGLASGLFTALFGQILWIVCGIVTSPMAWAASGLCTGIVMEVAYSKLEIKEKKSSNQQILISIIDSITIGITCGSIAGLITGLINGLTYGLMYGLIIGLIMGLIYGGFAWIQHFVLRFVLYRYGYTPWNYTHFLDYACNRLFLQRVGGGYTFIHRMLMEHFAEM